MKELITKDFIHPKQETREIILKAYKTMIDKGHTLLVAKKINKDLSESLIIITAEDYDKNMENPISPEDKYWRYSAQYYYKEVEIITWDELKKLRG